MCIDSFKSYWVVNVSQTDRQTDRQTDSAPGRVSQSVNQSIFSTILSMYCLTLASHLFETSIFRSPKIFCSQLSDTSEVPIPGANPTTFIEGMDGCRSLGMAGIPTHNLWLTRQVPYKIRHRGTTTFPPLPTPTAQSRATFYRIRKQGSQIDLILVEIPWGNPGFPQCWTIYSGGFPVNLGLRRPSQAMFIMV